MQKFRFRLSLIFKQLPYISLCVIAFIQCTPSIAAVAAPQFTYIGGSLNDSTYDSGLDQQGNLYIIGQTHSTSIDGINTRLASPTIDQNCFIAKINSELPSQNSALILGGRGQEVCRKILIDGANYIYIIGETQSPDFPVTDNSHLQGNWDGFLIKLDSQLNLLSATYIGGSNTDFAHGLAFYDTDNIAIVGETWSKDFQTTDKSFINNCQTLDNCNEEYANAFLYIVNTQDMQIPIYSTYLGGTGNDKAHSVATYGNRIVISGETQSTDFPLIHQLSNALKGKLDAFVSQFEFTSATEANLIFSSYLGGNEEDTGMQIKFDNNGNIIVSGESSSDDFPTTTNAFSQQCAGGNAFCISGNNIKTDIFVTQFDAEHFQINYSSLFGGSGDETPTSLLITTDNKWWITGSTHSENFPITDNADKDHCTLINTSNAKPDGFFIKLDPTQSGANSLFYSSFFGGDDADSVNKLLITNNQVLLTGDTESSFNSTIGSINSLSQNGDAFVMNKALPSAGKPVSSPKKANAAPVNSSSINPSILIWIIVFLWLSRRLYKFKR